MQKKSVETSRRPRRFRRLTRSSSLNVRVARRSPGVEVRLRARPPRRHAKAGSKQGERAWACAARIEDEDRTLHVVRARRLRRRRPGYFIAARSSLHSRAFDSGPVAIRGSEGGAGAQGRCSERCGSASMPPLFSVFGRHSVATGLECQRVHARTPALRPRRRRETAWHSRGLTNRYALVHRRTGG